MNSNYTAAALIVAVSGLLALVILFGGGDGIRAQEDDPIQCDTNTDARCIQQTAEARTAVALTAARATEDAEIEERVRTETWREAGATLVAERDYLYGEIQTANARLEGMFLPRYCVDHEESDYPWHYRLHYESQPDHHPDHSEVLNRLFRQMGDNCIDDNVAAVHDLLAPTATAIAALSATPTPTPEPAQ